MTSLWADGRVYYPLEFQPYTPASWFERGNSDPQFRTKPQIALNLVRAEIESGTPFRAVIADSFYGENEQFITGLTAIGCSYVVALKPSNTWWHLVGEIGSVQEVAQAARWNDKEDPGDWTRVVRNFADGHQEDWYALEGVAGPYGPDRPSRLIVVTTDPARLPTASTWYLATNLPTPKRLGTRCEGATPDCRLEHSADASPAPKRLEHSADASPAPGSSVEAEAKSLVAPADLAEIVRLYSLRIWVEQSYKQVKHALGWAQYQVRSDLAIRRHWTLVCCAFSFCWWQQGAGSQSADEQQEPSANKRNASEQVALVEAKKKERCHYLAACAPPSARMVDAVGMARTHLASYSGQRN